jgi:hypothetical protein
MNRKLPNRSRQLLAVLLAVISGAILIALPIFAQWLAFNCPEWMLGPAQKPGVLGHGVAMSLIILGVLAVAGAAGGVMIAGFEELES